MVLEDMIVRGLRATEKMTWLDAYAYRGALDAEITALDLEWKARQARIEYDLLTGSVTE
jgi:hypothetical protein